MAEPTANQPFVAWVVADPTVASALADGLSAAGVPATALPPEATAFARALAVSGRPKLVVLSLVPTAALSSRTLDTMDRAGWDSLTSAPLSSTFALLQALLATLGDGPLSVVLLGPSVGHVGASGLVPLATLLEAQRGLMKSAARQLGERGIRVNWVSVAPEVFAAELADAALPHGPEMGGANLALGHAPSLREEVASALALLAAPGAAAMTGLTLNLDGGEWMLT